MSPRFVLGRENVPCVAEVVNRSLKADCTDFTSHEIPGEIMPPPPILVSDAGTKTLGIRRVESFLLRFFHPPVGTQLLFPQVKFNTYYFLYFPSEFEK